MIFRGTKLNENFKALILALLLATGISFHSCTKDPNFSDVPEIDFISFSKMEMVQNSLNTDSLFLKISFKDGDGDLGLANSTLETIVLTDNRTGETFDRFRLPEIPPVGAQNGIEGEITLKVFTTCCIFPDGTPPCLNPPDYPTNQMNFDIYMMDAAGNMSNVITTEFITLLCD